ncbi:hypothetical protein DL769_000165 [Monosporascus sp. CRB-8-3]|nr:hypothetical protein DL769_000165 [Monosporascus sp. CRB-8-3]
MSLAKGSPNPLSRLNKIVNTAVYVYENYAHSEFDALSRLAAPSIAGTVVFAVVKPPLVKLSNVVEGGSTYALTISFYCLSYVLMAASKNFSTYAAGSGLHSVGQSGINLLIDIVITDIAMPRWRAFGVGLSTLAVTDLPLDSRARRGEVDSSLAGEHTVDRRLVRSQRGAAHRPALFEHHLAKHVPPRCFSNLPITPCLVLLPLGSVGFATARTYIHAGPMAAKWLGARGATFSTSANGIAQCPAGAAVVAARRYKWVWVLGAAVRLLIQVVCLGLVGTTLLVPVQIVGRAPRDAAGHRLDRLASPSLASSAGSCIAGSIYTNTLEQAPWQYLGELRDRRDRIGSG